MVLPDIEFEAKHGFKKPAANEEVIFYCRSGKRSATAADEAQSRGWKKYVFTPPPQLQLTNAYLVGIRVKNYSGSWLDWVAKEQERKKNSFDDD